MDIAGGVTAPRSEADVDILMVITLLFILFIIGLIIYAIITSIDYFIKKITNAIKQKKNSGIKLECKVCHKHNLKKENDLIICQECGCKYSIEDAKNLLINNIPTTETIKYENPQPQKNNNGCLKFAILFLTTILIFIIWIGAIFYTNNKDKFYSNSSNYQSTETIKNKPYITYEKKETELDFYIECTDNYSFIELEVNYHDKNHKIIQTETITGYNYQKGKTYVLTFTPKYVNEYLTALNSGSFSYKIVKYE